MTDREALERIRELVRSADNAYKVADNAYKVRSAVHNVINEVFGEPERIAIMGGRIPRSHPSWNKR